MRIRVGFILRKHVHRESRGHTEYGHVRVTGTIVESGDV